MQVPEVLLSGNHARDRAVAARGRPRARRGATAPTSRRPAAERGAERPSALVSSTTVAMNETDLIEQSFLRSDMPEFRPGDTVKVHVRVVEGNRERVQVFQGVVIRRQGGGSARPSRSARSPSGSAWSARSRCTRPRSPSSKSVSRGGVRRAKLYYLRDLRGKKARIKERRIDDAKLAAMEEAAAARAAEAADDDAVDDADRGRRRGRGRGGHRGTRGVGGSDRTDGGARGRRGRLWRRLLLRRRRRRRRSRGAGRGLVGGRRPGRHHRSGRARTAKTPPGENFPCWS